MKILFHLKFIALALMLNQMAQSSTALPEEDQTTTQKSATAATVQSEAVPQDTQQVSCVNYYLVNPIKAFGFGLYVGFGSPFAGIKELYDAARGTELTADERWSKARLGTIEIIGAPLVGLAFFMLSLRSLNHPNESL